MKYSNGNLNSYDNKKYIAEIFDSVDELIATNDSRENTPIASSVCENFSEHVTLNKGFYYYTTYSEARNVAQNGWQEMFEDKSFNEFYNKAKVTTPATKRYGLRNSVQGFLPSIPRYLSGIPTSMITLDTRPIKSKVLNIYYNICVSCNISTKEMKEAGIKVLQAIVELEKRGYRTNIYITSEFSQPNDKQVECVSVKIKNDKRMLNIYECMYALANPSTFRVHFFNWYIKQPNATYHSGLGSPLGHRLPQRQLNDITKEITGDKNATYINAQKVINNGLTSEDIIKQILNPND